MAKKMIYAMAGLLVMAQAVAGAETLFPQEKGATTKPKPSAAVVRLTAAVEGDEKNAGLRLELARALAAAGDRKEADKQYDIATALEPKADAAWEEWGTFLLATSQATRAEEKFRKALNLKGAMPGHHVSLGRALREQGRLGPAMNAFEQARDLDEKMPEAFFEGGRTLLMMGREEEGEANLRAALHLRPEWPEAQVALATLLLTAKDPARRNVIEGTSLLQKAVLATKEQDLALLVAYADALGRAKLPEQALETMEKAVALGKAQGISPEQREVLLARKQAYELAVAEPLEAGSSRITLQGTPWEMEAEAPQPDAPQPKVLDLLGVPFDLTKPFRLPAMPQAKGAGAAAAAQTGSTR